MSGLRWVEVGKYTIAAGEFGGGHVSSGEDIFLIDFGDIEENGKGLGVEENDDSWVAGDEWARWHVGSENRGLELLHAGSEVLDSAAVGVEVLESIFDGLEKGNSVGTGDFAEREIGGGGGVYIVDAGGRGTADHGGESGCGGERA